jgi:hypothetical protein
MSPNKSRREFLKKAGVGGAAALSLAGGLNVPAPMRQMRPLPDEMQPIVPINNPLDLSPAEWIWYPCERTLPSTFVLFRKTVSLASAVRAATGWVAADSRYLLTVNGTRVQWGPAPSDPRCLEVDPLDLGSLLQPGENTIGAQVLYYGEGDGTYPIGKPGFSFLLNVETADGTNHRVVSDTSWQTLLPRSWKPGHYKRWYLRALQEEFDARAYPYGWDRNGFAVTPQWMPAMKIGCPSDKPPICSTFTDYALDTSGDPGIAQLRKRSIPMMAETRIPVERLAESLWLHWNREPEEYFETLPPESFTVDRTPCATPVTPGQWSVELDARRGAALTFAFHEQSVGFPYFTIEAPAGTTIELMVQEGHTVGGPALLNTHFHSWARFVCRDGLNLFQTYDYECCRWLQLHIHGAAGRVIVRDVGMLRREFPWEHTPVIACSEQPLQRLLDASVRTLRNSAQETVVDGMGRERQQYSGDGGHQLHGIHLAFGEPRLPARFISTFSRGQTPDGFFLDCWPAYDRLARLMERQVGLTQWGPLVDHGVGFVFDCHYHHLYTGDLETIREVYPRLQRFVGYLKRIQRSDGLLPVENLGIPNVWIDHIAYLPKHQHHKQCAFNLYAAAMLEHAFAPIAKACRDPRWEEAARDFGREILSSAVDRFWDPDRKLFVINRPWLSEEQNPRLCDRSLATAVLFDQCPGGNNGAAVRTLAETPPEMGISYPANASWRTWALARGGRPDVILKDFRERWATMDSVVQNNTIGENWNPTPDSADLWSHCAIVPLYGMFMCIAGIVPIEAGFARCRIRPQLADLTRLDLVVPTRHGKIEFQAKGAPGDRSIRITLPRGCEGELVFDRREKIPLPPAATPAGPGLAKFLLRGGDTLTTTLHFS